MIFSCVKSSSSRFFTLPTDDSTEPKELKRPRLDTGKDIFSLLTSVFDDVSKPKKTGTDNGPSESVNSDGDTTIVHMSDTSEEVSMS